MSEPKLISPMLDRFLMGDPISSHDGVRACPAIEKDSDNKYIVKIISIPASQTQLDALVLAGAYPNKEAALPYFKGQADGVLEEVSLLKRLSELEGFSPFEDSQLVPMDEEVGYDVYLLAPYQKTLRKILQTKPMTHLMALNLGLDMCAALAVCRRSGYLFANLKPENITMTESGGFRIGDLGFLKLDGISRAVLPARYQSAYTAPEIADAYSSPNETIDIYALGLILYQVYNGGQLPFTGNRAPAERFAPPMYADYEMAEIILKACAPDPADRWQNPMELGQTLVGYMQRNGVNDTPIIPVSAPPAEEVLTPQEETTPEETVQVEEEKAPAEAEVETIDTESVSAEETTEEAEPPAKEEESTEEITYAEDDFGNFSFLDFSDDETAPENTVTDVSYDEVGEDVSQMLSQADDLAAHEVPDPVVAPEPVDVPIPEPVVESTPSETEEAVPETEVQASEDSPVEDATAEVSDTEADEDDDFDEEDTEEEDEIPASSGNAGKWIRNTILILLAIAIILLGILFYRNYYLQPIRSIKLEGSENTLTVYVDSDVDEALLTVICADTYGNYSYSPVIDGKATFTDLTPDTGYTVNVNISGFHRLTGDISDAYSTPVQTNIIQLSATTGSEDGSVLITFRADGPDSERWKVIYSAEGVAEQELEFSGHTTTVTGLVIGKEYTFRVVPVEFLYIAGEDTINYTPSKLVFPEELMVTELTDNMLTVQWLVPENSGVSSWTVRCNSGTEFDQTITTESPLASFEIPDKNAGYTIEVTAANMSMGTRIFVDSNAITLSDVQFDNAKPTHLGVSWSTSGQGTHSWIVSYSVNGFLVSKTISTSENNVTISPVLPGAEYEIRIQAADGTTVIGQKVVCTTAEGTMFERGYLSGRTRYYVSAENFVYTTVKAPDSTNWGKEDLADSDYTSTFSSEDKASLLVEINKRRGYSDEVYSIVIAVMDEAGTVVGFDYIATTWDEMWEAGYLRLDLPTLPENPGTYVAEVYFNGCPVGQQEFSVSE